MAKRTVSSYFLPKPHDIEKTNPQNESDSGYEKTVVAKKGRKFSFRDEWLREFTWLSPFPGATRMTRLDRRSQHAISLFLPLVLLPRGDEHAVNALNGVTDAGHHRVDLLGQVFLDVLHNDISTLVRQDLTDHIAARESHLTTPPVTMDTRVRASRWTVVKQMLNSWMIEGYRLLKSSSSTNLS
ncbi:hypothetical protein EYF80_000925 [Liparis tanakae]|uniref:Uncharacterized protein n=1 Tax=Liparis tanakae TaxID=230148 RepID=A0A4Z2JFM7_9TELE|nr:hypothetical protein EYF80_000925 [Liparis tanakae]